MISQRWIRLAVSAIFLIVGLSVAFVVLQWYKGPLRGWLALGIALLCMVPFFLWETIFPPPIDLTAYSETVDYEFLDESYAREFAALNKSESAEEPA